MCTCASGLHFNLAQVLARASPSPTPLDPPAPPEKVGSYNVLRCCILVKAQPSDSFLCPALTTLARLHMTPGVVKKKTICIRSCQGQGLHTQRHIHCYTQTITNRDQICRYWVRCVLSSLLHQHPPSIRCFLRTKSALTMPLATHICAALYVLLRASLGHCRYDFAVHIQFESLVACRGIDFNSFLSQASGTSMGINLLSSVG